MKLDKTENTLSAAAAPNPGERRKHQRFKIKNLALAVTKESRLGRIVNISKGGMAVQYFSQEEWENTEAIDILVGSIFFVTDVPIQYTNDFKVGDEIYSSNIGDRQCCMEFGSLSDEQKKLFDEFIENLA